MQRDKAAKMQKPLKFSAFAALAAVRAFAAVPF
jgi:hypothetical protein